MCATRHGSHLVFDEVVCTRRPHDLNEVIDVLPSKHVVRPKVVDKNFEDSNGRRDLFRVVGARVEEASRDALGYGLR